MHALDMLQMLNDTLSALLCDMRSLLCPTLLHSQGQFKDHVEVYIDGRWKDCSILSGQKNFPQIVDYFRSMGGTLRM
eukprot:c30832_g1_i1 orf=10-240(-)